MRFGPVCQGQRHQHQCRSNKALGHECPLGILCPEAQAHQANEPKAGERAEQVRQFHESAAQAFPGEKREEPEAHEHPKECS
jgi:hypothetical protein